MSFIKLCYGKDQLTGGLKKGEVKQEKKKKAGCVRQHCGEFMGSGFKVEY